MMKRMARLAIATLAGGLMACGSSNYGDSTGPTPPAGPSVEATTALAFTPATLTVKVGDAVAFVFDGVAHNVFFDAHDGAPADIAGNNAGVIVSRTFATAGTYTYTCQIHPSMHGTVVGEPPAT
jgi:plastocyanin